MSIVIGQVRAITFVLVLLDTQLKTALGFRLFIDCFPRVGRIMARVLILNLRKVNLNISFFNLDRN